MENLEENHICLNDDIKKIIVETDEENPIQIVVFDRTDEPIKTAKGYRVRLKFIDN